VKEELIEFLAMELETTSLIATTHGWICPKEVIEKIKELRAKISELEQVIGGNDEQ
jgi:hypothetical protein